MANIPGNTAIPEIVECAIKCPSRVLRWRMKADVTDVDARSQGYAEGLDAAIEVLVV